MGKTFLKLVLPLLIINLVCILAFQVNRLDEISKDSNQISELEDSRQKLQLKIRYKLPKLGFSNIVSSWTFLEFLQYFGDYDAREKLGHSLSPYFFNIIVKGDPRFLTAYPYLSTSISMHAGQPDVAISLMDEGLQSMTPTVPKDSYIVWRYKGIDELLFAGDGHAAKQSFLIAADWAQHSSHPEAELVVQSSRQTAQFLEGNPDSRAAQINAWSQVLVRAVDDETRRVAVERIENLGGEVIFSGRGSVEIRYRIDEESGE